MVEIVIMYTDQLEREADRARAQVTDTLEELLSRISPGRVMDQLVDYTWDGPVAKFLRNLGRDIRENPLPLALMGVGVAWLMMKNGNASRVSGETYGTRDFGEGATETTSRAAAGVKDKIGGLGEKMQESVAAAANSAAGAANQIGERIKPNVEASGDAISRAGTRASEAASQAGAASARAKEAALASLRGAAGKAGETAQLVKDKASSLGSNAFENGRQFFQFCKDQPLVLAGLGLAAGAAIGALAPATETENRLMGEASDQLKQAGREQYGKAKDTATQVLSEASQEASEELAAPGTEQAGGDRRGGQDASEELPAPGIGSPADGRH
jgi:hypothetical protein